MENRIKDLMLLGSSAASVEEFLDAYKTSDSHYIAVIPQSRPNGVIAYRKEDKLIEILDIAVDPEYRNQGLGSALVKRMIDRHLPDYVTAETDDDAVGFYRKLGFNAAPFKSKWGITRYKLVLVCT